MNKPSSHRRCGSLLLASALMLGLATSSAKTAAPLLSAARTALSSATNSQKEKKLSAADKAIEKRIDALISRMTLQEKVLQLSQGVLGSNDNPNNIGHAADDCPPEIGSVIYTDVTPALRNELQRRALKTRLGIPVLFGYDIIHGFRTIQPIPLAMAASFDTVLVRRFAHMAAVEGQASGVDWTFAPMVDIARDGRWGRVMEGYGEDPHTASMFARAAVHGFQSDDPTSREGRMAACLKHFVGYGASEAGIDYAAAEVSRQTLWDTYLPPFHAGVEAGAMTLMSAFCDLSGTPATASHYTLTDILKKQWGHEGFVVSDWSGVVQLRQQRAAESNKDAVQLAFNAGVEMEMVDGLYKKHLPTLIDEGKVSLKDIDEAVRRVLRIKMRLGLFDHPLTDEKAYQKSIMTPSILEELRNYTADTYVLLKNQASLLPLEGTGRIALLGPLVSDADALLGNWRAHGRASDAETLASGMEKEFGTRVVGTLEGCPYDGTDTTAFSAARELAMKADVLVLCMGEKSRWSGENASVASLELPQVQEQFIRAMQRTGRPIVLVLSSGRPMALANVEPLCSAIVEIWKPGIAGGTPLARLLSGKINPSARLPITFPRTTAQVPVYYNRRRSSRPTLGHYRDQSIQPLFPFGSGLSYTTFRYSNLRQSGNLLQVDVTNTGARDGSEVALWYITAPAGLPTRPNRELRHFEKRAIPAGQTVTFSFNIQPETDLAYPDADGKPTARKGTYRIEVGGEKMDFNL